MKKKDRITELESKIDLVIDEYNMVKSQNIAMNHALAGLFAILPSEVRGEVLKQYDLRCATFQMVVNDGRTDLDALAIQRKQFATVRERIFRDPAS